jgi:hypothetical protein
VRQLRASATGQDRRLNEFATEPIQVLASPRSAGVQAELRL